MLPPAGILSAAILALTLHPNSVSSSRIQVEGVWIRLELRCQAATLLESVPLDRDGDRRLSADELEAGRAEVERYVLDGYRLSAGTGSGPWTRLQGRMGEARLVAGEARNSLSADPLVDLGFRFDPIVESQSLRMDFSLFRETNPWHRDHAEIVWFGKDPQARLLWIEDPTWVFQSGSSGQGAFLQYVIMGCEHILSGYDHIAFIVALVVASRRLRGLLGVVTAFTLAHSVTLALAALDVVRLPSQPVEAAIALSIAWVGLRGAGVQPPRRLWPEAFGFGLVHGLGFARILADSLAVDAQKLRGLVGFNLGIEFGQLGIVAVVGLLLKSIRVFAPPGQKIAEELAQAPVRRLASVAVGLLGLYWLVSRIFPG